MSSGSARRRGSTFLASLGAVAACAPHLFAQLQHDIVFSSYRDGNYEIYRMHGDGGGQTRLTSNEADDKFPQWSPDGSTIIFVSERDGNLEVYSMRADGSEQTNLSRNPAGDQRPVWSTDGSRICWPRQSEDGTWSLWTMDADGGNQRPLTFPMMQTQPAYSPDGRWIAFQGQRDGVFQIHTVRSDGRTLKQLTNSPLGATSPTWSPDGKRIAYMSEETGDREIWVMRADGTGKARLTRAAGPDEYPVWSPDGAEIVFVSSRDGNRELYSVRPDGTGERNLTSNPANDWYQCWSDGGEYLVFVTERDGPTEIYVMDRHADQVQPLSRNTGSDDFPNIGPRIEAPPPPVATTPVASGLICFSRFILVESRMGIFLINPDGSGMRELPNLGIEPEDPTFSPDRTRIAYHRRTSARRAQNPWEVPPIEELVTCDLQGGNQAVVARGGWFYDINWSADGTRILFRFLPQQFWDKDYVPKYWWIPATGGDWQELPIKALDAAVSPNGRDIVWSIHADKPPQFQNYPAYLWVTDVNGNNARQLTMADDAIHDGAAYSPDGRTIAFYCRKHRDTSYEVRLIPEEGGPQQAIFQQPEGYRSDAELAWSPDGTQIVLCSGHVAEAKHSLYVIASSPPTRLLMAPLTDARGAEWRCDWR